MWGLHWYAFWVSSNLRVAGLNLFIRAGLNVDMVFAFTTRSKDWKLLMFWGPVFLWVQLRRHLRPIPS